MASLIKKQILKHLSKFTKNLSADKINLSTLRGEGELSNLELDCVALQNVMNLPTWLEFRRASCNKVSVKIAWTKLKTVPICIYLDAVEVDMVTCEKPRPPNGPSPIQASASSGDTSYGFTEKVLEGMAVTINSISINFTSAAFKATFQLSQLYVISTNPKWEKADLRYSRITDKTLGQVLTFKKLSWQTMRIVADAITTNSKSNMTPLRLITNQSEIRMTFRRRISDCYVLATCLHVHFDDLLWVLTDSQVQSALLCVKSLRDTIDRSNQQMRELGLDKMQEAQQSPAKPPPVRSDDDADALSGVNTFAAHTVVETSYHIDLDQVDLHICEEGSPIHQSSKHMQGGAIQISLHNVKVDHYPYHKPASERTHFRDYGETMKERNTWADGIIKQFRRDFVELRNAADKAGNLNIATANKRPLRLIESCLSVRLLDIDVHEVTTSNSKKHQSGRLLNSTRKDLHLPDDMPLFHFIRTEYYYPDGRDYPAPHNNIFMQLNAPRLNTHWDSLLWLNRLTLTTVQAVQKMLEDLGIIKMEGNSDFSDQENVSSASEEEHVDIRIQVLMPKIFIPGPSSKHPKQPHGLEIQVSRASVTNCRDGIDCSRGQLSQALDALDQQYLAKIDDAFPNDKEVDLPFMQEMLRRHAVGEDLPLKLTLKKGNAALTGAALKSLAINDVWGVDLEQVWIDFIMPLPEQETKSDDETTPSGGFLGSGKTTFDPIAKGLHLPFLDSFPATLWIGKSADAVKLDLAPKMINPGIATDLESSCTHSASDTGLNLSKPVDDTGANNLVYNRNNCNEHSVKKRCQTDADQAVHLDRLADISSAHSLSKSNPNLSSASSNSSGKPSVCSPLVNNKSSPIGNESPRTKRNQQLLEYYRSNTVDATNTSDQDTISQNDRDERVSISSVSSTSVQKIISTLILIHTDKSVRLQLDHYQYLSLLRMIEHIEEVGTQLELDSKEILLSPASSTQTSPAHSTSMSEDNVSNSVTQHRKKLVNTSSVRLCAPSADLFLILRPPPSAQEPFTHEATNSEISGRSDTFSSSSTKSGSYLLTPKEELISPKQGAKFTPIGTQSFMKAERNARDTPPLSESGSDSLSMQGFDNISIFGDGVYPHTGNISYMIHENQGRYPGESCNEDSSLSSKCESPITVGSESEKQENDTETTGATALSKKKSGSLSILSNQNTAKSVASQQQDLSQMRNYSADNLATSVSLTAEQASFHSASTAKSNSSGYESGSNESLPPNAVKSSRSSSVNTLASSFRASHSHSSSNASDQFVIIQVDENGKGLEDNGIAKLQKTLRKHSPSSLADSVSLRSETSMSSCPDVTPTTTSGSDSKTMLELDSLSSCGLADSQITMTNARSSASSLASEVQEEMEGKQDNEREEKKPDIDMSSLVKLHVSHGVGLAIDSNDVNDSVIKIVASTVDVAELGLLKTDKIDSIFVNYAPKKSSSIHKKMKNDESSIESSLSPQFCLRIDSGPLASRFSPAAVKDGHIHITADSVPLTLNSSTLSNLGAFVEDEVVPEVVPMRIEAKDVKLTIKDDLPPVYKSTPPAPPITLHVHGATVLRSEEGTFHVTTTSSGQLPKMAKKSGIFEEQESKGMETNDSKVDISLPDFPLQNSTSTKHNPVVTSVRLENVTDTNPNSASGDLTGPNSVDKDTYAELLEKIVALERERDALTLALNHMQEELITSERERSNLRSQLTD